MATPYDDKKKEIETMKIKTKLSKSRVVCIVLAIIITVILLGMVTVEIVRKLRKSSNDIETGSIDGELSATTSDEDSGTSVLD